MLVHFTIGGLPLIVIAYTLALWYRRPLWAFVGDAALVVTAGLTLATGAFGLVSNAVVPWPGGLERWRAVHLAGGVATTVLLLTLAALRIWSRRRHVAVTRRVLCATFAVSGIAGATGWIGGEVLVFHAGMAVRAAGDGALAGPVTTDTAPPTDFLDAMRQVRAAWGSITAISAGMIVQHPRDEDFAEIERHARRMETLAHFMGQTPGDVIASMSQVLGGDADDLAEAAAKKDLQGISRAVGETSAHCAACHEQTRWRPR
ncbi:MAG: DUF2231 domain-containing protein [Polyangia bacterium]